MVSEFSPQKSKRAHEGSGQDHKNILKHEQGSSCPSLCLTVDLGVVSMPTNTAHSMNQ